MERLTFDDNGCNSIKACENDMCRETCAKVDECSECPIQRAINTLSEYEDMEEQGRLVKLPCKVGDTVYADSGVFGILEYIIDGIVIDSYAFIFQASAYSEPIGDCPSECLDEFEKDISEFGKTVFLTREQAEQSLKQEQS